MRIVIIGAGIAGLSSYLYLDKVLRRDAPSNHSIIIYESHDISHSVKPSRDSNGEPIFSPKAIGAALGIAKNGLAVLQRIDEHGSILRKIQSRGHAISRWKMKSARGWTITDATVTGPERVASTDQPSTPGMIMIARYNVWDVLRDGVLEHDPEAVIRKKLIGLEAFADGQIRLHFKDGSTDMADLVIGADGLRSFVRHTMFKHSNDMEPQTWTNWILREPSKKKDYTTPQFEYLIGLGGFVPTEILKQNGYEEGTVNFTFGSNGFFGYGYTGKNPNLGQQKDDKGNIEDTAVWWSTFSCLNPNMFRKTEGEASSEASKNPRTDFDKEAAVASLLTRHQSWQDPVIQNILKHVAKTRAMEHTYPTYTTPELPTWQMNGNMVLIGDAAHALQPSSGQGVSQALEDSEALALFLKHHLESDRIRSITRPGQGSIQQRRAIGRALNEFVAFRKPRVAQIYRQSQRMGRRKADMSTLEEILMYFFIWLMSKLPSMQKHNQELFEYNLPAEVATKNYETENLCTLHKVAVDSNLS